MKEIRGRTVTLGVAALLVLGAGWLWRAELGRWLGSTGTGSSEADRMNTGDVDGIEYTCSMHPSVRLRDPGVCPICSMDLVPVIQEHAHTLDTGVPEGIEYYSCSMHPSVRSTDPGTCPICSMDLVPVTREEVETGTIVVDVGRRQLIGVKTAPVVRKNLVLDIRAVGSVTYAENRLTDITLRFSGWVGKVLADYTGITVQKDHPLFTIYSPELLSAQEEFLEESRRGGQGRDHTLREAARRRLRLWNFTARQIAELEERGEAAEYVPILSPVTGTVIEKHLVDGSAVKPGMLLYRIADLSTVWVVADIYEADIPLVQVGQAAHISLSYLPGKAFSGTVSYVYPYLEEASRTARFRLEVPNPSGALKPEMYVNVELQIPQGEQLMVPQEAVVMSGKTDLVFIDRGQGRLQPQKVRLGRKGADGFVVLDGLREGDIVVTSGNFLIAAESKLKAGLDKW